MISSNPAACASSGGKAAIARRNTPAPSTTGTSGWRWWISRASTNAVAITKTSATALSHRRSWEPVTAKVAWVSQKTTGGLRSTVPV
jgi:hypothetical protein